MTEFAHLNDFKILKDRFHGGDSIESQLFISIMKIWESSSLHFRVREGEIFLE